MSTGIRTWIVGDGLIGARADQLHSGSSARRFPYRGRTPSRARCSTMRDVQPRLPTTARPGLDWMNNLRHPAIRVLFPNTLAGFGPGLRFYSMIDDCRACAPPAVTIYNERPRRKWAA